MVPCAYLRVFEPLDALPEDDRQHWGRYVAEGGGLSVDAALANEAALAASRLVTGDAPGDGNGDGHGALVRRVGRRIHLCPLQVPERQAVALLAFRDMLPDPAIRAFVSRREARSAISKVKRLRRPPHIQESSWEIPLRWFAAFDPDERHFVDPPEGDGPRLSYLTRVEPAMERLDRAVDAVEGRLAGGEQIVEALVDLVEWLANFHDDSLLELDYGGLNDIIASTDLALDSSCEDVWKALESLERGDAEGAAAGYQAVAGRWAGMRHRYRTN